MRASGVLLPITSIPSKYGIGCFSEEAYEFVNQLERAGQRYWQILPMGPTGYGDSPYQAFSTFAGNPYFVDPEELCRGGLLTWDECQQFDFGDNDAYVDYGKMYNCRYLLLHKAFERFQINGNPEYENFCRENGFWLSDYAMFMVLRDFHEGKGWTDWEEEYRNRVPSVLEQFAGEHERELAFYQFVQFEFYRQWENLKRYANERKIRMIGDLPIYVAFDSADTWSNPKLFQFDEENRPLAVAGCPPDGFSPTGQLWGNPLYDWDYHKKTEYDWWKKRVSHALKQVDVVRIDHFRGFDAFYAIPYGDETAQFGKWMPGPGMDLFQALKEELGEIPVIAEDLGFLTDSVKELVKETGYPGMKIIQFAFDSKEPGDYLTHNYERNCIVYTGTHDNNTTCGWYDNVNDWTRQFALDYIGREPLSGDERSWAFIRLAQSSVADTCIIPIQDYLCLGAEARINEPSTFGNNWKWRLVKGQITEELLQKIRVMTELYGRC